MNANYSNIPAELKALNQWVCWQFYGGRKLAISATTGQSKDWPHNLADFETAQAYAEQRGLGLGFAFNNQSEFLGVDLDGCRNPESGLIESWAISILDQLPSFREISPSRTGLRIICRGHVAHNLPTIVCGEAIHGGKRQQIEFFTTTGYTTITGLLATNLPNYDINNVDCLAFYQWLNPDFVLPNHSVNNSAINNPGGEADESVLKQAAAYLATIPGAISGQGGHNSTFTAACKLIHGFNLTPAQALPLLQEWNQKCVPPWSKKELQHKLDEANKCQDMEGKPRGYLLRAKLPLEDAFIAIARANNSHFVDSKQPCKVGSKKDQTPTRSKSKSSKTPIEKRTLSVQRFSDIDPQEVVWLWKNRIALGKLTLIVGEPGLGKTFVAIDIASRVSAGADYPDGSPCEQGKVLFLTCEDGPGDTIRPRLDAHGADVVHVMNVRGVETKDGVMEFIDFGAHLETIEEYLKDNPGVRLFVIDPISAFLGDRIDSHNNTSVRSILGPICELAERYGMSVVGITHLAKKDTTAINRVIGSIAFVAAARAAWLVAQDDDDADRRLFLPIKNNLAKVNGLAYRIIDGRCQWEDGEVLVAADDIGDDSFSPRDEAKQWLEAKLAKGPVGAKQLFRDATGDGISQRTLKRAKKELGIESTKVGDSWCWCLAAQPPSEPPDDELF